MVLLIMLSMAIAVMEISVELTTVGVFRQRKKWIETLLVFHSPLSTFWLRFTNGLIHRCCVLFPWVFYVHGIHSGLKMCDLEGFNMKFEFVVLLL